VPQYGVAGDVWPERTHASVIVPFRDAFFRGSTFDEALHIALVALTMASAVARHVLEDVSVATRYRVNGAGCQ
jgi:hypothetical protein